MYKQKYLKYKQKYLNLKLQFGLGKGTKQCKKTVKSDILEPQELIDFNIAITSITNPIDFLSSYSEEDICGLVDMKDKNGNLPIHNYLESTSDLNLDILERLLPDNMFTKDANGNTIFHILVKKNDADMLESFYYNFCQTDIEQVKTIQNASGKNIQSLYRDIGKGKVGYENMGIVINSIYTGDFETDYSMYMDRVHQKSLFPEKSISKQVTSFSIDESEPIKKYNPTINRNKEKNTKKIEKMYDSDIVFYYNFDSIDQNIKSKNIIFIDELFITESYFNENGIPDYWPVSNIQIISDTYRDGTIKIYAYVRGTPDDDDDA